MEQSSYPSALVYDVFQSHYAQYDDLGIHYRPRVFGGFPKGVGMSWGYADFIFEFAICIFEFALCTFKFALNQFQICICRFAFIDLHLHFPNK